MIPGDGDPGIDTTLVPVAKQGHQVKENEDIKEVKVAQRWQANPKRLGEREPDGGR